MTVLRGLRLARTITRLVPQEDNAHEWLQEVLDSFGEDDYVVFDCPGQARWPLV